MQFCYDEPSFKEILRHSFASEENQCRIKTPNSYQYDLFILQTGGIFTWIVWIFL